MKTKFDLNDYVFASKYCDRDPNDPWAVDFISEINIDQWGETYYVNNRFFRYVRKITKEEGVKILQEYSLLEIK